MHHSRRTAAYGTVSERIHVRLEGIPVGAVSHRVSADAAEAVNKSVSNPRHSFCSAGNLGRPQPTGGGKGDCCAARVLFLCWR